MERLQTNLSPSLEIPYSLAFAYVPGIYVSLPIEVSPSTDSVMPVCVPFDVYVFFLNIFHSLSTVLLPVPVESNVSEQGF